MEDQKFRRLAGYPLVTTDLRLPDTTAADISVEVTLKNNKNEQVTGTLSGKYGDISFEKEVTLEPLAIKVVRFDPSENSSSHFENPKLWWPRGYGLADIRLLF
jgi:hypothetical protein